MPKPVIVCIPTFNEKENIAPLFQQLFAIAPGISIVVADDSSPDPTRYEVPILFVDRTAAGSKDESSDYA